MTTPIEIKITITPDSTRTNDPVVETETSDTSGGIRTPSYTVIAIYNLIRARIEYLRTIMSLDRDSTSPEIPLIDELERMLSMIKEADARGELSK